MIRAFAAALILAAGLSASEADRPRIPRAEITNLEKFVNAQLQGMYPDEPWLLLGPARGVYVEGVGVVFSAEVSQAMGPTITPFNAPPTKEVYAAHHQKKVQRVPKLRETMYGIIRNLSSGVPGMPQGEQVVLAITLLRYQWETGNDLPSQIVMWAPKSKLDDPAARNIATASLVKTEDY